MRNRLQKSLSFSTILDDSKEEFPIPNLSAFSRALCVRDAKTEGFEMKNRGFAEGGGRREGAPRQLPRQMTRVRTYE